MKGGERSGKMEVKLLVRERVLRTGGGKNKKFRQDNCGEKGNTWRV